MYTAQCISTPNGCTMSFTLKRNREANIWSMHRLNAVYGSFEKSTIEFRPTQIRNKTNRRSYCFSRRALSFRNLVGMLSADHDMHFRRNKYCTVT